jgi:diguanylate cyclase (GGDEF)-like protein/PAS domain S-box-containing protein
VALDALQSGVWDYNTADQQFFTSPRFRRVLGYPQEAELDAHLKRLFFYHERIHEDDRARIAEARHEFLNHGTAFDEQYRLQMPGRIVWIRESAQARLGPDGKPVRFTGSISDVTASTEIQQQLRESERLHRSLIETLDSFIWHTDAEGVLTFASERGARSLYGYEAAEMVGRKMFEFAAPESLKPEILAQFDRLARRARVRNLEMVHLHKSGARMYLSVNAVPLFDESHGYVGAVGINTNISHIKKRQRSFQETVRLQRLIFDSAGEGMVIVRNGRVYRANEAFVDLLGGTKGEITARPLSTWCENPEGWQRIETQLEAMGGVLKVEQPMRCLDGRSIWVLATGRLADAEDYAKAAIWVFADITSKKREEDLSWHRANHDELTGLPNRRMLQDRLEQALGHARRESTRIALLMLDLDGFKQINDTHGHRVGDEVLRQIAGRMSADVRQLDTVGRLGGDEFMMVLHSVESIQDVEVRAQRLIDRIQQTILFENLEIHIGTSIGIGIFPDNAHTPLGLMHAADLAMYAAKASGKNTYRLAGNPVRPATRMQSEEISGFG